VPLSASSSVTFGRAISTVAVTAFAVSYYGTGERRTPANAEAPSGLVAIDVSKMCDAYLISK